MANRYAGVDLSYANDDVDYSALKAGKIKGYMDCVTNFQAT